MRGLCIRSAIAVVFALGFALPGVTATAQPGAIVFSVFSGLPVFEGNNACDGLYAVDADGGDLRRLTAPDSATGGRGQLYPSLTLDARSLSFTVFAGSSGTVATLYNLDGADGRVWRLATVRAYPLFFRFPWSLRGPFVLLPRQQGARKLAIDELDARSGRRVALTARPADYWPAWSPDGSTIAFTRGALASRANDSVWLAGADGTRERRLAGKASDPAWSPDGRRLAVFRPPTFSNPIGPSSLWIVERSSGKERLLARGLMSRGVGSASWSPGGNRLLVLLRSRERSFPGFEHGAADAYSIDATSGRSRLVARHVIPVGWFADGIVFLRGRFVEGETVSEIRITPAGKPTSSLVGVVDEEDVNIGSYPARQLHTAAMTPAVGAFAPPPAGGDECLQRLAGLIRTLR
jgi:hypothetical protein